MIENLYQQYYEELVNWCTQMTTDQNTAQELVQEGFLKAIHHWDIVKELAEPQRRAWLYRTIKNLFIDQLRSSKREVTFDEMQEFSKKEDQYDVVEWNEILNRLSQKDRMLFKMRYLEGYTSQHLSTIFHLPEGTIRYRLLQSRKLLRRELGGHNEKD